MRPRIAVSFSAGRTSGYMAKRIKDQYAATHDIVFTFANTSKEDERTLVFADRCDREFGLNLVWLEAVVNPVHGEGTRHRVTDFQNACRRGEVFEEVIKKYGIPNQTFQPCNREMKTNVLESYRRSIGWDDHSLYKTAIGIRADEMDRVNPKFRELGLWYPLLDWGVTKQQVLTWWSRQTFDLEIPEHYGNCVTCWKKSDRKLKTLAKENPALFDWNVEMETKYAYAGAGDGPRVFFRHHRSTLDILAESKLPFVPFVPKPYQTDLLGFLDPADEEDDCGKESCEAF